MNYLTKLATRPLFYQLRASFAKDSWKDRDESA